MCKAIDDCNALSKAASLEGKPALATKKRVRFHAADFYEFEKVVEEKEDVWYNRHDFQQIRADIAEVVQAKANNDERCLDENWYCFRGLEFLKLDDTLSRKERRQRYSRHVLVYQAVTWRMTKDNSELLRAFCTKLSQGGKQRALQLAAEDEAEARSVYQECHLIYQVDGEDRTMFGSHTPSLCRKQESQWEDLDEDESSSSGYFNDVFGYTSIFRAIQTMGNAALQAARVQ